MIEAFLVVMALSGKPNYRVVEPFTSVEQCEKIAEKFNAGGYLTDQNGKKLNPASEDGLFLFCVKPHFPV